MPSSPNTSPRHWGHVALSCSHSSTHLAPCTSRQRGEPAHATHKRMGHAARTPCGSCGCLRMAACEHLHLLRTHSSRWSTWCLPPASTFWRTWRGEGPWLSHTPQPLSTRAKHTQRATHSNFAEGSSLIWFVAAPLVPMGLCILQTRARVRAAATAHTRHTEPDGHATHRARRRKHGRHKHAIGTRMAIKAHGSSMMTGERASSGVQARAQRMACGVPHKVHTVLDDDECNGERMHCRRFLGTVVRGQ